MATSYVGRKMSRKERRAMHTGHWRFWDCERKRRYGSQDDALKHKRLHPGKKPYACQWCGGWHFGREFVKR